MLVKIIIKLDSYISSIGSEIMKSFLRLTGAKIGKNTFISISSKIAVKKLIIGNDTKIKSKVKIKAKMAEIGNSCIISESVIITGQKNLKLGDKSYVGKKAHIDLSRDVTIGEDVGIGENSLLWTHGYYPPIDKGYPVTYDPITIEENVWVSTNIIIMPGVTLQKNIIVGAGSIVTKSFEKDQIIAGNPAKTIKPIDSILSQKSFCEIMTGVIHKIVHEELSMNNKSEDYLIITGSKIKFHILDNCLKSAISLDESYLNIVIYKGGFDFSSEINKPNLWIDLEKRVVVHSNNKFFNDFISKLKSFGIRCITKYK